MRYVFITLLSLLLLVSLPLLTSAQGNLTNGNGPATGAYFGPETSPVFGQYAERETLSLQNAIDVITEIRNFLLVVGIIITVAFLVWSGITYIMAGGDETKVEEAKKRLLWTIIGAAVILAVFILLETIRVVLNQRTFFTQV